MTYLLTLKEKALNTVGTERKESDDDYLIKNINNIKSPDLHLTLMET